MSLKNKTHFKQPSVKLKTPFCPFDSDDTEIQKL